MTARALHLLRRAATEEIIGNLSKMSLECVLLVVASLRVTHLLQSISEGAKYANYSDLN